MSNKFYTFVVGVGRVLMTAISSSTGLADAKKIVATDETGRINASLLPPGVGSAANNYPVTEALPAGSFVNIFKDGGVDSARMADASNGRAANGFILGAVPLTRTALVYSQGLNTQLTGLNAGTLMYLSATNPGKAVAVLPADLDGVEIIQELGYATAGNTLLFEFDAPAKVQEEV